MFPNETSVFCPLSSSQKGVYPAAELYRLRRKRLLTEIKHHKTGKITLNFQIFNFLLYEMYGRCFYTYIAVSN